MKGVRVDRCLFEGCCPLCSWSSRPLEPGWPRRATLHPPWVHLYDLRPETAKDSQHIQILSPTASLSVWPRRRQFIFLLLTSHGLRIQMITTSPSHTSRDTSHGVLPHLSCPDTLACAGSAPVTFPHLDLSLCAVPS